MSNLHYRSESGDHLKYLAREGQYYLLLLYFNGLVVFTKRYEYHQRAQAERERDALVSLGHLQATEE